MKPLDDLRKAFGSAGVDLTKPIVTTCGSGVSALVLTLALYRLPVRCRAPCCGWWAGGMGSARRTAGRDRPGLIGETSALAISGHRLGERIRRLLSFQPRAQRHPAALRSPPRLQAALLDNAAVRVWGGGFCRR